MFPTDFTKLYPVRVIHTPARVYLDVNMDSLYPTFMFILTLILSELTGINDFVSTVIIIISLLWATLNFI